MIASKTLVVGVIAATGASADLVSPLVAAIRARQDLSPGSPLYNCHDNCGEAILESQAESSVCNDNVFLTDYANCLQCAGPDNANIWQYYGNELTAAAAACHLATTPEAGSQAAVGTALPAKTGGSGGSGAPSSAPATTTAASVSSAAAVTTSSTVAGGSTTSSSATASGSGAAGGSKTGSQTTAKASTTVSASTSSSATVSTSASSTSGQADQGTSATGAGSASGIGGATKTTTPASTVVTAGASVYSVAFGLVGAAAAGVACALAF